MKTAIRLSPRATTVVLVAVTTAAAPDALALGFRIPNQDAVAIGRGNAFVATADNPAALYYNPAGITQLEGIELQVGLLSYLGIDVQYRGPDGSETDNVDDIIPVPQVHFVYSPPESPFSFGLGVYAPFGLAIEWPDDAPFRTVGLEGHLTYLSVNPVAAWQPMPSLSIAAGPTINYSKLDLRQGLAPVPGNYFDYEGDGLSPGFNVGVLWQPHPKWSFGATYRSAVEVGYSGDTEVSIAPGSAESDANVDFPQMIVWGVSFRPTPRWNLEVDIDWTDWATLDTVTLEDTQFGDVPLALNWRPSFFYEAGVTHYFPSGYFVSAGYFFSENSTSDENFNPVVPDTDLHVGSIGVGYKGEHWRWAVAGQIITGPWRSVSGSQPSLAGQSADGDYQLFIPAVTVSVGYRF